MPVVFREAGYRFHFYSHEGSPREPVHVHVSRPGATAKLWLFPDIRLSYNRRMTPREMKAVELIVEQHREEIADAWNAYFAGTD